MTKELGLGLRKGANRNHKNIRHGEKQKGKQRAYMC